MPELNHLERQVLEMLLAGEHPALDTLRNQLRLATVKERDYSGVGFFTAISLPSDTPRAKLREQSHRFGDVEATVPGLALGIGFLLFIDDGLLTMLEGYTYGEPWPASVETFRLAYHNEPRTDLQAMLP